MNHVYLIWIELDLRLLGFLSAMSILVAALAIALFVQGRRWHEYFTAFLAFFVISLIVSVLVCNFLVDYPVFTVPKFQKAH
ncbi:MAG: hypothetical protein KC609_12730 [Myxococcales bacterium]|nr:hypothetical protein [Myxococcales bacterium]